MKSFRQVTLVLILGVAGMAFAGSSARPSNPGVSASSETSPELDQQWRIEGEKRYRANCGRCHQPPRKLPPRAMATVIRHMRVRAMLSDDDMKFLLYYMTQ